MSRTLNCAASVQRFAAGDGLLLYTDGLIEARGAVERYGSDRLAATLRAGSRLGPSQTLEYVKQELQSFAGEQLSDDVCLLVLRTG